MRCGGLAARVGAATRRGVDILISAGGLLATSPILATAAAAVRFTMGRPVFFRQERAGFHERPFRLIKLRTMRPPRPSENGPDFDHERLTPVGRFLRDWSLDEVPTLWNVLRGDMSLVGPRPLPVRYSSRYTPEQKRRHEVKPGITGLAQVTGRNLLSWDEKFALDVWYVDHRSLALDAQILARTLVSVVRRTGINQGDATTMPEFTSDRPMAH